MTQNLSIFLLSVSIVSVVGVVSLGLLFLLFAFEQTPLSVFENSDFEPVRYSFTVQQQTFPPTHPVAGDAPVAYARCRTAQHGTGRVVVAIQHLLTLPLYRRSGIATRLVQYILQVTSHRL